MSQENQVPRIDPENRMDLEFHAPRTLGRKGNDGKPEFENLDPEARRAKIVSPETKFREEAMRAKLLGYLDRIEGVRTPEQQALLDGLMGQRKALASVWTEKFPLEVPFSKAEIMAKAERFLQGLPANVLQGLLAECPKSAQLVVVPGGIVAPELLRAIDGNKTVPGQIDGKVWSEELWAQVQADGWRIAVTDGQEDRPFDPSIYYLNPEAPEGERQARTNEQQVAEYERRFNEQGLGLMPQYGYVPAAANRLAGGKVLDRQFWTAFKRPQMALFLPNAFWDNVRVNLRVAGPGNTDRDLRCRLWVEGEM